MDWVDYVIGMGVNALLNAIKDPNKKKKVRDIALKVYKSLKAAYAGDPDFQ